MKKILTSLVIFAALSACAVDPQAAAERRENLKVAIFPDPANQQGLFLVFPLESGGAVAKLIVISIVDEVSDPEVARRIGKFCYEQNAGFNGAVTVAKDFGQEMVTLPDGTQKLSRNKSYACVRAS